MNGHMLSKHARVLDPITLNRMAAAAEGMARNYGSSDRFMNRRGGGEGVDTDPRRSLEDEYGWPIAPDPTVYDRLYNCDTIAARIVSLPPMQSWRTDPWVFEFQDGTPSAFEDSLDGVVVNLRGTFNWYRPEPEQGGNPIFEVMRRADILSRKGRYGGIWYGFDDEEDPWLPVEGLVESGSLPFAIEPGSSKGAKGKVVPLYTEKEAKAANNRGYRLTRNAELEEKAKAGGTTRKLLFMRPYGEVQAKVTKWEGNRMSPRYCMPLEYLITTLDPGVGYYGAGMPVTTERVHWLRFQHIADTHHHATSNESLVTPALQVPLYDVLDARKITGAGAESVYRNVFQKIFFETLPQLGADAIIDYEGLRDMMEDMENGVQKHGGLAGLHANPIPGSIADVTPTLDGKYKRIAIHMGKPKRIFEGSERGEMSSGQDEREDGRDNRGRQERYVSTCIVAPGINMLIRSGVVAPPGETGFKIEWPDGTISNDAEEASTFATRMTAFSTAMGGDVVGLLGEDGILQEAGYDEEEVEAKLAAMENRRAEEEEAAAVAAEADREQKIQDVEDGLAPDLTDPAQQPQPDQPGVPPKPGQPGQPGQPAKPPGTKAPAEDEDEE